MGKSKTEHFSEATNELSAIGKCISHPARIAIIEYLLKSESCICGDIVASLPLSQSTVSQHLKELKSIGLIKGEISGPNVCYCIDVNQWNFIQQKLGAFFNQVPKSMECETDCC
jgi:predicted transcriptional regulator